MAGFWCDAYLQTLVPSSEVALLVNDPTNTLTHTSSMAAIVALEIAATNGYLRASLTPITNSVAGAGGSLTETIPNAVFTASGGAMPQFTHLVRIIGGLATHGDTTGTPKRIDACTGSPINLVAGQNYTHSLGVTVTAT